MPPIALTEDCLTKNPPLKHVGELPCPRCAGKAIAARPRHAALCYNKVRIFPRRRPYAQCVRLSCLARRSQGRRARQEAQVRQGQAPRARLALHPRHRYLCRFDDKGHGRALLLSQPPARGGTGGADQARPLAGEEAGQREGAEGGHRHSGGARRCAGALPRTRFALSLQA